MSGIRNPCGKSKIRVLCIFGHMGDALTKPFIFITFMTYWLKFLQTINSPVKNIFPVINTVLVLIIVSLMTIATRTWIDPKYPDKVDVDSITYVPKTLEPLVLTRKTNNARTINSAVQANLFRKDRKEYMPPVQVAQVVRKSAPPALPPPNLKLKGVLLLGTKKIAILEGNFPVQDGNQGIKKKPLKRKGYPLGAKIGNFELTAIEKNKVTLNNNRGVVLNLNLAQRPEDKIIRRVGNTLIQKNKNFDPGKIKKATLPRPSSPAAIKRSIPRPQPVRAPRAYRISGSRTDVPVEIPRPHVSGK